MIRGTTPTLTALVDEDLSEFDVYLSFKQMGRDLLVKTGDDLVITVSEGVSTVECHLSQEETLSFSPGLCDVQIRGVKDGGETAIATEIRTIGVGQVLQDGALS